MEDPVTSHLGSDAEVMQHSQARGWTEVLFFFRFNISTFRFSLMGFHLGRHGNK